MTNLTSRFLMVCCWLTLLAGCDFKGSEQATSTMPIPVVASQAYTPEPVPTQKVAVAYLELQNTTKKDVQILHVTSPVANSVEVHRHTYNDGVMQMRKVNHAKVPAGGELLFQSGGYHIMLMGLERQLEAGDSYDLTFEFDQAQKLTISVPVRSR